MMTSGCVCHVLKKARKSNERLRIYAVIGMFHNYTKLILEAPDIALTDAMKPQLQINGIWTMAIY